MNRLEIALFVVAFAAGCLAGGVPEGELQVVLMRGFLEMKACCL